MSRFYQALLSHYDSKVNEALATLDLYFNKSVGIGEHPDVFDVLDKYITILDENKSKLETLRTLFNITPQDTVNNPVEQ
jgi:hypothetical protein